MPQILFKQMLMASFQPQNWSECCFVLKLPTPKILLQPDLVFL